MVRGCRHPNGYHRLVAIYLDIITDIRAEVRVELSVLRTVRPGGWACRGLFVAPHFAEGCTRPLKGCPVVWRCGEKEKGNEKREREKVISSFTVRKGWWCLCLWGLPTPRRFRVQHVPWFQYGWIQKNHKKGGGIQEPWMHPFKSQLGE